MSESSDRYFLKYSHDFDEGPSGPARSYYDIHYGDMDKYSYRTGSKICVPKGMNPPSEYCYELNEAVKRGERIAQAKMRAALGLTNFNDEVRLKK